MVRDAFQSAGWDVQSLGANAPAALIVDMAVLWKPDIVGLSASLAPHLPTVKDVIARLRQRLCSNAPAVMLGGQAFDRLDHPARMLGADEYAADAQAAVTCANIMVHAEAGVRAPIGAAQEIGAGAIGLLLRLTIN